MKLECVLAIMAALGAVAMAAKTPKANKCPPCKADKCEPLNAANCLAGVKKDDCGCCDICGKQEGEPCDLSLDQCGDGLTCKNETGVPLCQCIFQEVLCGNDNKTYTNLCKLMVTAVIEHRTNTLNVKSVGPCDPAATIVTKPESIHNVTGTNVGLQCEAMGNPTPTMAWAFTRADNKTTIVPGDDNRLVISVRGGPGKHVVTSWLQIEGLLKHHEGDYTCVAYNQHHTDRSKARIKVKDGMERR